MKRIIFILSLVLLFANANSSFAAASVKDDVKAVKNVLKAQIESANKYSYPDFVKYFDLQYVNSDGFNIDIYSKLVEDTWAAYSNIQYAQKIKNISVNGKDAIAEVVETANAQVESQYNLSGSLKSIANNVYFLRKTPDGWRIVSDVILTEDTYLSFGEMEGKEPTLTVPYQTLANRNYTATLEYQIPKEAIAIASINQERVSFPQQSEKENYRKLPEDGILERFFTANNDSTNEYVVASIGLTRPVFDNKDLQISVTGVAYIIKRVNVVPQNKFINTENVVPVSERLQQLAAESRAEQVESKDVKAEKVEQSNKIEETIAPVDSDKKPAKVKKEKTKKVKTSENTPVVEDSEKDSSNKIQDSDVEKVVPKKDKKIKKQKLKEKEVIKEEKPEQHAEVINLEGGDNVSSEKVEEAVEVKPVAEKIETQEPVIVSEKVEKTKKEKKEKVKKEKLQKSEKPEKVKPVKEKKVKPVDEAKATAKAEIAAQKAKVAEEKRILKEKKKEAKRLKGAFSPDTVDIPVTNVVCPVKEDVVVKEIESDEVKEVVDVKE